MAWEELNCSDGSTGENMTYLSMRMREIREEEAVPKAVREAHRRKETVRFLGRDIDPVTAWRITGTWPWEDSVSYLGRGA